MTADDLSFLKSQVDAVVLVETLEGDRHPARVLFVFDEGETPDVFYLKVERASDGGWVQQQGSGGCSVLLSDIVSVRPVK